MVVKNLFELKSAKRVIVDGNTLENNWVSGQTGYAVAFTPRTNAIGGSGLLAVVDDITFTNNVLKNVSSGFTTLAHDGPPNCLPTNGCTSVGEMKRVVIYNNLIQLGDTTQVGYTNGAAFGILIPRDITDLVFQHNTVLPPPNLSYCKGSVYFDISGTVPFDPPYSRTHNIWILDNALCRQVWGPTGFVGQVSYSLPDYMGDPSPGEPRLFGNVFYAPIGDKPYPYPPHNYISTRPFSDVNPSSGNYQLLVPTWTDTSDGKISGVNGSTLPIKLLPLSNNVTLAPSAHASPSGGTVPIQEE